MCSESILSEYSTMNYGWTDDSVLHIWCSALQNMFIVIFTIPRYQFKKKKKQKNFTFAQECLKNIINPKQNLYSSLPSSKHPSVDTFKKILELCILIHSASKYLQFRNFWKQIAVCCSAIVLHSSCHIYLWVITPTTFEPIHSTMVLCNTKVTLTKMWQWSSTI